MMAERPVNLELPLFLRDEKAIAVAVSGGPDSMALAWLLWGWACEHDVVLHVLSVDHGLRAEAAAEVAQVADIVAGWDGVVHHALHYKGEKPKSAVQEEARALRYDLMAGRCQELGVKYLCLAHHQDDQGETFLFRLAKGSGLDGLCAMRPVQAYDENLTLVRPVLDVPKAELVALCEVQNLPFVSDPSNEKAEYARVRIRQAREVLEAEGLSNKRLASTAQRLQRGQEALEEIAARVYEQYVVQDVRGLALSLAAFDAWPCEIVFRSMLRMVRALRPDARYSPRMERLEDLFEDLCRQGAFRKRTLGGLIFEVKDKKLHIYPE